MKNVNDTPNKHVISNSSISFNESVSLLSEKLRLLYLVKTYPDRICIQITATNKENTVKSYEKIKLFDRFIINTEIEFEKVYIDSQNMMGYCGPQDFHQEWTSYGVAGLTSNEGDNALLVGFEDIDTFLFEFKVKKIEAAIEMDIYCFLDNIPFDRGETKVIGNMIIFSERKLSNLFSKYAERIVSKTEVKIREQPENGWCSWYYYYGTENQQNIIENVIELKNSFRKETLKTILIDDGWNLPSKYSPCVWGDWFPGRKFSKGMKEIVNIIHENFFNAGLWLAPFAVSDKSEIYRLHPDWISGTITEVFNSSSKIFGLDLTNPNVLDFIEDTFDRVYNEWGFDFVKIDFLYYGTLGQNRFDKTMTSIQAFRKGLETIRKVAKERYILNCGSPILHSVGYCDGMRIGADVGNQWCFPINTENWQYGNCSIKPALNNTLFRQWMNGVFWQNDADCLILRDKENGIEYNQFKNIFTDKTISSKMFGLETCEVKTWLSAVWFTKSSWFLSDIWSKLPCSRRELMKEFMNLPQISDAKLIDAYYSKDLVFMQGKYEEKLCIAIFNLSDNNITPEISSERFDLDCWSFVEIFGLQTFSGNGKRIEFPEIPFHGSSVYRIQ